MEAYIPSSDVMPLNSETVGQITAALAKAQSEFPPIVKNQTVKYSGRVFQYADLQAILAACLPSLNKNEIAPLQTTFLHGDKTILKTLLSHSSGEFIASYLPVAFGAKAQDFGSSLTYMKRYSLSSLLAVAADEDDDGQAGAENVPAQQSKQPQQSQQSKQPDPKPSGPASKVVSMVDSDGVVNMETYAEAVKDALVLVRDPAGIINFVKVNKPNLDELKQESSILHAGIVDFAKKHKADMEKEIEHAASFQQH